MYRIIIYDKLFYGFKFVHFKTFDKAYEFLHKIMDNVPILNKEMFSKGTKLTFYPEQLNIFFEKLW